jgi:hypothetical protein
MRPQHECAEVLRVRVEHLFRSTEAYLESECRKYNIRLGPAPPDEPRLRLAYYERYVADSERGAVETTPWEERFGSKPWLDKHPSIAADPQKWFEIVKLKKAWDEQMYELQLKRVLWDLPPEIEGGEPPPDPSKVA